MVIHICKKTPLELPWYYVSSLCRANYSTSSKFQFAYNYDIDFKYSFPMIPVVLSLVLVYSIFISLHLFDLKVNSSGTIGPQAIYLLWHHILSSLWAVLQLPNRELVFVQSFVTIKENYQAISASTLKDVII